MAESETDVETLSSGAEDVEPLPSDISDSDEDAGILPNVLKTIHPNADRPFGPDFKVRKFNILGSESSAFPKSQMQRERDKETARRVYRLRKQFNMKLKCLYCGRHYPKLNLHYRRMHYEQHEEQKLRDKNFREHELSLNHPFTCALCPFKTKKFISIQRHMVYNHSVLKDHVKVKEKKYAVNVRNDNKLAPNTTASQYQNNHNIRDISLPQDVEVNPGMTGNVNDEHSDDQPPDSIPGVTGNVNDEYSDDQPPDSTPGMTGNVNDEYSDDQPPDSTPGVTGNVNDEYSDDQPPHSTLGVTGNVNDEYSDDPPPDSIDATTKERPPGPTKTFSTLTQSDLYIYIERFSQLDQQEIMSLIANCHVYVDGKKDRSLMVKAKDLLLDKYNIEYQVKDIAVMCDSCSVTYKSYKTFRQHLKVCGNSKNKKGN